MILKGALLCLSLLLAGPSLAQSAAELEGRLIASWLITVESESRERVLKIEKLAPLPSGAFQLDTLFGYVDEKPVPLKADLEKKDGVFTLTFTNRFGSKANAILDDTGVFRGTFTDARANVKKMTLVKTSEAILATKATPMTQPGADVPPACAAFFGGWVGDWPNVGRAYLWVRAISADCSAQVTYGRSATPTGSTVSATIKGTSLVLPRPDGGTTTFEMTGTGLLGRYRGPAGTNEGRMERVESPAAAANPRPSSAMVPPGADLPADCAAFHGEWAGTWTVGSIPEQILRIEEIQFSSGSCKARYSYSSSKSVPATQSAEVTGGAMTFACNPGTGGTCVFKAADGLLQAAYSNPSGGRNSATFRKVR